MQPYQPRRTVDGQAMCPMCANNEEHRMNNQRGAARIAVRTSQEGVDIATLPPAQGLAYFIAQDQPPIVRLAHDSGDSVTVFHCPFCGSGQVIARSDGSIACDFCKSSFTVQVQPEFSAFPQTINGVPVQVPGMGPDTTPIDDGQQPLDEGAEGGFPPGEEDPEEEGGDPEEDEGTAPPFGKKSFRTAGGREVPLEAYLKHLAIETTHHRGAMIARIRAMNRSR